MRSDQVFYYFGFLLLGAYINIYVMNFFSKRAISVLQKEIEDKFSEILKDKKSLRFIKRLNNYVYFQFHNNELIYLLSDHSMHIFKKEKCIASSPQIKDSKVITDLLQFISNDFTLDINNVVYIGKDIYSKNMIVNNEVEDDLFFGDNIEESFDLDGILDKINKIGYNNLTEKEKEFLNSLK